MLTTRLNNGIEMPLLGLGVYEMHDDEAVTAVTHALQTGYRLIDTASMYNNEVQVGMGVRASGIPRHEIFVTTKVNNNQQGYDQTLRAFEESMKKLDIGHIDLYLLHWPIKETRKETWKAMERLYDEKLVRGIGVANYLEPFLDELATYGNVMPAVDQVEFSPWLYLKDLLTRTQKDGIALQAYTPLARGKKFDAPLLQALKVKYSKTEAQLVLRWILQLGVSAIPKSSNPARIEENFGALDFTLSQEDMILMASLHEGFRVVDDPLDYL
jgi:diketogulonate reductase-like aldo/keto reductase